MSKMKLLFLLLFFPLMKGESQIADISKFVNSFKEGKTKGLLEFRQIVGQGVQMNKEEALKFAYNGDSTRLYCTQKTIDMETEKVSNVRKVLFLPNKCFKKNFGDHYLIIYLGSAKFSAA